MPVVIETLNEFIARHGAHVRVDNTLLFHDGALLRDFQGPEEPPTDPYTLLILKREYTRAKVAATEQDFRNLKTGITNQTTFHSMGAGPAPPPEAIEELRRLKGVVQELREKLGEIEEQIAACPETKARQAMNDFYGQQRAYANELFRDVSGINI